MASAADTKPASLFLSLESLLRDLVTSAECNVYMVEPCHNKLFHFIDQSQQQLEGTYQQAVCDIGTGVLGRAGQGEKVHIQDCSKEDCGKEKGSWLAVPICHTQSHEGEEVRVLAVVDIWRESGPLDERELALLSQACTLINGSIRRMLVVHEEEIRRRTAEALLCVNRINPKAMELTSMLQEIVAAAYYMSEAARVTLFFVDEFMEELWVAKSKDFDGIRIPLKSGLCGHAAVAGEVVNVSDCYMDERFHQQFDIHTGFRTRSVLCMPIPPPDQHSVGQRTFESAFATRPRDAENGGGQQDPFMLNPLDRSRDGEEEDDSELDQEHPRLGYRRPRTMAVLQLLNKRDGEVFDCSDEDACRFFCTEIESLLRQKSVDAAILKRVVMERQKQRQPGVAAGNSAAAALILNMYDTGGSIKDTSLAAKPAKASDEAAQAEEAATSGAVPSGIRASYTEEHSLVDWNLNVFETTTGVKHEMLQGMFRDLGCMRHLETTEETLNNFIQVIWDNYRPNPFHNTNHAFDVAHITYMMIKAMGVSKLLSPLELLVTLVAAFCHDVDHPGNNNAFESNSLSPLTIRHADSSVLEKHHIHTTFRLLLADEGRCNIFSNISRDKFKQVRGVMIKAILATDMVQHMQLCDRLSQLASKQQARRRLHHMQRQSQSARSTVVENVGALVGGGSDGGNTSAKRGRPFSIMKRLSKGTRSEEVHSLSSLDEMPAKPKTKNGSQSTSPYRSFSPRKKKSENAIDAEGGTGSTRRISLLDYDSLREAVLEKDKEEDRIFIIETIVHCSDLGGQVSETHVALEWGRLILQEFANQARREQELGLPLTFPLESCEVDIMKGQLMFLNEIVAPLWEPVASMFPALSHCVTRLDENRKYYENELRDYYQQGKRRSLNKSEAPHPDG
ncbi:unnamed protein product [Chrysoparadoxa australica]